MSCTQKLAAIGGFTVIFAITTRITYDKYQIAKSTTVKKKKVVVIGAGYAGRTFVKNIDVLKYDVVLIDKHLQTEEKTYLGDAVKARALIFHPQPNYVDAISEGKAVTQFMFLPKIIKDIKGECVDINQKSSQILLKPSVENPNPAPIDYDYLVFATGSIPDTYNVKMNYDCLNNFWYFFKDRSDLETLMTAFNMVGVDEVVIMGGGITGVELASELSKRLMEKTAKEKTDGKPDKNKRKTITILEAGDRLLPRLKESTSEVITRHLVDKQNVEIVTSANIKEISGGKIKLIRNGSEEMELKTTIAVWTCGVKPDELAVRLVGHNKVLNRLQLTSQTAVQSVETTLEPAHNIFAIGDCNNLLPKSAQHSKQQGKYLAEQFNAEFKGDPNDVKNHFHFQSQGSMIRLSDRVFMDSPVYTGMLPLVVHHAIIGLDL